ncbi:MAG: L-fuculose phosphate aldolase [Dehalococcoidia bacterium]|nr:L-fuculose phosphate aldolase [Bacillota bacterium]
MTAGRKEIIETTQLMCRDKLVLGTWGNVSVREGENRMLITPSGMDYSLLTPEDLVSISLDGQIIEGFWQPSSEWRLHAAIFAGRPDVEAIVHTHSVYATAFAVARLSIPPVVEEMVQVVGGGVDVADYALPGSEQLAKNAVNALGAKSAVVLASHGLVGVSASLTEALKVCQIVEKTAQAVLFARQLGSVYSLSENDILMMRSFYQTSYGPGKRGEAKK